MPCPSCASDTQGVFPAEMIIHLAGLENVDKPGIWVFPNLLVCLVCGFSSFTAPKEIIQAGGQLTGKKSIDNVGAIRGTEPQAQA
jgi:hypothetical protein